MDLTGVLDVEKIQRHRGEDLLEERQLLVICKLGYDKVHKLAATLADRFEDALWRVILYLPS